MGEGKDGLAAPRRAAMNAAGLLLSGVAALLTLAVAGAFGARRPFARTLVYGGSLALSTAMLMLALVGLLGGANGGALVLPLGLPWIGAHFRVDALSSFFLVVVNLGAAAASLYGLGYGRTERAPERVLPFFSAFLASMNLVLLADDAYTFLLSWEFMSLASWALVMAHHREDDNARAGYVYLVMASFGTLALLLAFALLAGPAGGYAFDAMRAARPTPGVAALAFILALIGAGSKAGIAPLHVWLPLAHPAAPSHVSALMSGVMTKVAVYGFVRIVFELAGPAAWWWSVPVLAVGASTALLGVLYALMQHDLKRLLAYHTVENIGIIYIGLGLALAFKVFGMPAAAASGPDRGPAARVQPFSLQEPAVLRRGRRAVGDGRTRHEPSRGPHSQHAPNGFRLPRRLRRDFGFAAVQRLRLRMADISSHIAEPGVAVLGAEDTGARGRGACWRCRPRSPPPASARRSA